MAGVRAKTGWELAVSDSLTVLQPPTVAELTALRQLHDGPAERMSRLASSENKADQPSQKEQ